MATQNTDPDFLVSRRALLTGAGAMVAAALLPTMAAAQPDAPTRPPGPEGTTIMTHDLNTINLKTIKTRVDSGVLFATLDGPPINMIGPDMVRDLISLLDALEHDDSVRVVVFASADKEYFISYVDIARLAEGTQETAHIGGSASGSFGGLFRRLSEARQVTIAQVEGFARAAGSEFALACDMRFASRERAVFGQVECALGTVPGAGALQHLTRLLGRGRAMEAILSSGDFDADLAERYGWVNRALPQAELGPFVEALARRIARSPWSAATRPRPVRPWPWPAGTFRGCCSTAAPSRPGRYKGRDITIQDVFEGVGAAHAGRITDDDLRELEDAACPGAGSCGGQFTANTMAIVMEFLGLAALGSAGVPAVDPRKDEVGVQPGT